MNPWDAEYWEDADRSVRLRDVGGRLPIPEWRELTWSGCVDCGGPLYGPADESEGLYDGDPAVCPFCGCLHSMSADAEGWALLDQRSDTDSWIYLRPTALAGFRRLLGVEVSDG